MMQGDEKVEHQFVFRCPECAQPILVTENSTDRHLEQMDGKLYDLDCKCGWNGRALGMLAKQHRVTIWKS